MSVVGSTPKTSTPARPPTPAAERHPSRPWLATTPSPTTNGAYNYVNAAELTPPATPPSATATPTSIEFPFPTPDLKHGRSNSYLSNHSCSYTHNPFHHYYRHHQRSSSSLSKLSLPDEYCGSGMQDTPPQNGARGHKRGGSKKGSPKANGGGHANGNGEVNGKVNGPKLEQKERAERKEEAEANGSIVQEKYKNTNGGSLMGIRPSEEWEESLRQDKLEEKQKGDVELVSGRKAGAGWERSSIRWAPLNIPVKRRLQTGMVLFHTLCPALCATFFFWLCAVPLFWPIVLPYLLYILFSRAHTSGDLSLRSEPLRRSGVWSLFASYFPARLHRSQELPATRKYIFGYHPHGIISHGAIAAFATEALGFRQLFPGIINTLLTLDSNFRIPLYRDYLMRLGLRSVSRESCENLLTKGGINSEGMGRAITIVVGGASESLEAMPRRMKLVLKRRKGFVKLAIRTGADLVPVLAFGENDIYEQVDPGLHPWIHKAQLLVKKWMGFTVPLFHARGIFNYDIGLMPYRRPINIVVGRPIMVQVQKKPDDEYVEEIHAKYVEELKRVWEEWKDVFAPERVGELDIIE